MGAKCDLDLKTPDEPAGYHSLLGVRGIVGKSKTTLEKPKRLPVRGHVEKQRQSKVTLQVGTDDVDLRLLCGYRKGKWEAKASYSRTVLPVSILNRNRESRNVSQPKYSLVTSLSEIFKGR